MSLCAKCAPKDVPDCGPTRGACSFVQNVEIYQHMRKKKNNYRTYINNYAALFPILPDGIRWTGMWYRILKTYSGQYNSFPQFAFARGAVYNYITERERAFEFMEGCVKMRMRTIDQAAEYVRAIDPDTALTKTAIRRKVIAGEIPSSKAGRKYLLDLDRLEEFLFSPSAGTEVLRG